MLQCSRSSGDCSHKLPASSSRSSSLTSWTRQRAIDLDSLRCFDLAARHLNFRAAARAASLSPAAFGQRIAGLERELQVSLFQRTTRRVSLTETGARLAPLARGLLREAREFAAAARAPQHPAPYELTLATRFELGLSWLTPALTPLAAAHPERRLHLSFGDNADLIARVRDGSVDAAITSARLFPAGLRHEELHAERYAFVASAESARSRPLREAADARQHVLLDIGPELPLLQYLLNASGRATWRFERLEYLGTIAAIRLRVYEGAGVAVLPRYFVQADLAGGRLVELCPGIELDRDAFRLLWRADHPLQGQLMALAAELRALPLR